MRKIVGVLCLIVMMPFALLAQSNLIKHGKFAGLIGYNYNQGHWGELGIVRGYRVNYVMDPEMPGLELLYPYASLSSEFLFKDKFIMCPKLGYHFVLAVVDLGINVLDYTDWKQHSVGVRPEIGFTLGGMFGVYYGYNILTNQNFNVSHHNFGAKIIIGSGLFMDKEKRDKRLSRMTNNK